jgi:hypothetical protein
MSGIVLIRRPLARCLTWILARERLRSGHGRCRPRTLMSEMDLTRVGILGLTLALGCGGKVAGLGESGDAGLGSSSGGSSNGSSSGSSGGSSSGGNPGSGSSGGHSESSGSSASSSGGSSGSGSVVSSGSGSGSSSGGSTGASAPAAGTPACEDEPCILCADGYYHCHSTVYPPCMAGISTSMNCANEAIPSYGCFVCGSDGTGNLWQCTDSGWSLGEYACTP